MSAFILNFFDQWYDLSTDANPSDTKRINNRQNIYPLLFKPSVIDAILLKDDELKSWIDFSSNELIWTTYRVNRVLLSGLCQSPKYWTDLFLTIYRKLKDSWLTLIKPLKVKDDGDIELMRQMEYLLYLYENQSNATLSYNDHYGLEGLLLPELAEHPSEWNDIFKWLKKDQPLLRSVLEKNTVRIINALLFNPIAEYEFDSEVILIGLEKRILQNRTIDQRTILEPLLHPFKETSFKEKLAYYKALFFLSRITDAISANLADCFFKAR